jgi:hypothetical protein
MMMKTAIAVVSLLIGFILGTEISSAHERSIATFTDRNGYFAGGSIAHGNKTDFYDARGLYQGSATRQSTSTSHRLTDK